MIRSKIKATLRRTLPIRYLSEWAGESAAIIRYHSIHSERAEDLYGIPPTISHHVDLFQRQMEMIAKNFNLIDMDTISGNLSSGAKFGRRSVAITFDDGYRNNLTLAAPILERFDIRGTFYVLSENINVAVAPWFCQTYEYFRRCTLRRWHNPLSSADASLEMPEDRNAERRLVNGILAKMDHDSRSEALDEIRSRLTATEVNVKDLMLSRDDVIELISRGHCVGSHTHSHPNLALVSNDEANFQIAHSRSELESALPKEVRHFCFPNPVLQPHWTSSVCELIESAGYATAVTCTRGIVTNSTDTFAIPRFAVPHSVEQLEWDLNRAFARI